MEPGRDLEAAYRATDYTADTPRGKVVLRIGRENDELDRLLAEHGVNSWAYITAYNPASIPAPAAENEANQRELRAAVERAGHAFFEGAGVGEGWPPEPSLLVLGITGVESEELGRRFGQLAVVVGERGGVPRLLWLGPRP
jgi:hypothetical protein